jgi:DNA-binding NarL/FixJ family response regulator
VSAQTVRKAKKKMQATLSLATGAPSGARSLSSIHAVSRRELQVASLIRAGLQNKEIAATLGTSIDTVRKQTIHAYAKLGVSGRLELVTRFGDALKLVAGASTTHDE